MEVKVPLVSIIIPTYNRACLIGETLQSIQNQKYRHWECLVIDDGSQDDTKTLVSGFHSKDNRIKYHRRPESWTKGSSGARNFGISIANGEYVNWFDSDDIMHPEKLMLDIEHITSGDYDFTISQSDFFNESSNSKRRFWNAKLWSDDPINDFVLMKIGWGLNSPLWKRSALKKHNLHFNENLETATDYMYHIEALTKHMKPIIIDKILVSQREHNAQMANYDTKAPSKLFVNNVLYQNKAKFGLHEHTISVLNQQYKYQYSNLLKKKHLGTALKYLLKIFNRDFGTIKKFWFIKTYILGIAYYITGKGYQTLDK